MCGDNVPVSEPPDIQEDTQFVHVGWIQRLQRRVRKRPEAFDHQRFQDLRVPVK